MNFLRRWVSVGITGLVLCSVPSTFQLYAQDVETTPLIELLTHIPGTPENRNDVLFVDRRAIETAYPGAQMPANFAAFDSMLASSELTETQAAGAAWWNAIFQMYIPTGRYLLQMGTMPNLLGIDYFDIDQELQYGTPPNGGLILAGEFQTIGPEVILGVREYQEVSDGLWCLDGDCTTGQAMSLSDRDLANPFGGEFGRFQPILVQENLLASSTTPVQLGYTPTGEHIGGVSLADHDDIVDAIHALESLGTIVQVAMWDGTMVGIYENFGDVLGSNIEGDTLSFEELPPIAPYSLFVIGDVVSTDEQMTAATFVFETPEEAQSALDEMQRRLDTLISTRTSDVYREEFEGRDATIRTQVFEGENYAVGLLILSTDKPTVDDLLAFSTSNTAPTLRPGLLYSTLYRMVISRDTAWFAYNATILTNN